jgi:hypothetical protein
MSEIKIREYQPSDEEKIIELLKEVFGGLPKSRPNMFKTRLLEMEIPMSPLTNLDQEDVTNILLESTLNDLDFQKVNMVTHMEPKGSLRTSIL